MTKSTLFHPGELYFQKQTGVEKKIASLAPRIILDYLTSQHQNFYSLLNMLFIASVDKNGQPWASVILGSPGFIHVIDEKLVCINANLIVGDPLNENLKIKDHLGFLGLEFQSRRRNRMSGQVIYRSDGEIVINVDKAFGNCPKYIQTRKIDFTDVGNNKLYKKEAKRIQFFDKNIKQLIALADTFFISSYYPQVEFRGADVSHRGGKPGFIRIENDKTLVIDDFIGNNVFMTLGNLHSNPVAGLLFINFTTGDILQLACRSEIIEATDNKNLRQIRLTLDYGWFFETALSIESKFLEYSPFLN